MLTAALYARYSSGLQRPTSIDDQLAFCRAAAPRFGCEILAEHVYTDAELSGSNTNRPGYQRLLAAAKAQAFGAIIIEAQDRLWRNQAEMHTALRLFRFLGVKVFSVATGGDMTDYGGRVVATVMGLKDELYLEDLRAKTHRGLAGQATRGFVAGGRSYGYTSEPVTDPQRVDAHGAPRVLGYRRVITPDQASVVVRIFEEYAGGRSPRQIAQGLTRDGIAPPRGQCGWTWTALYGSPRLGTGILRNRLYTGEVSWNRFRWEKDPETGKRVPRLRSRDEWVLQRDESLRIVSDDLWRRAQAQLRYRARGARGSTAVGGRPPKYLFSGLLICGRCGAHYALRDRNEYACSFHRNRGSAVCDNRLAVARSLVEARLLDVIRRDLFGPDEIAYVAEQMTVELRRRAAEHQRATADRKAREAQLRAAVAELDNIREAIRRGLLTDLTRQMLEEAEERVRQARAACQGPAVANLAVLRVLPSLVESRLDRLERVLSRGAEEARTALRQVIGPVTLRPDAEGKLVAEFRGNIEGLLSLDPSRPSCLNVGSGGRI